MHRQLVYSLVMHQELVFSHMMHCQLVSVQFCDAPGSHILRAVAAWDLQVACSKKTTKKQNSIFNHPQNDSCTTLIYGAAEEELICYL